MQVANRQSLETFRPVYNMWVEHKSLPQFDYNEVWRIVKEEWDANYKLDAWCGACIRRLLEDAFRYLNNEP